jgi:hypothetical protein
MHIRLYIVLRHLSANPMVRWLGKCDDQASSLQSGDRDGDKQEQHAAWVHCSPILVWEELRFRIPSWGAFPLKSYMYANWASWLKPSGMQIKYSRVTLNMEHVWYGVLRYMQFRYAKQSSFEKLQFEEGSIRNCPNRLSSPFTSYMPLSCGKDEF